MPVEHLCQVASVLSSGAVDTFVERNDKLFVLQCRSAESEFQQTVKHQLLDCEHLFLIPALPPQDVIELLRVFGSISFTDVYSLELRILNSCLTLFL